MASKRHPSQRIICIIKLMAVSTHCFRVHGARKLSSLTDFGDGAATRVDMSTDAMGAADLSSGVTTMADLSSHDLIEALDPDTSLFWAAMADAIGDRLASTRSNSNATSLLERESLIGEHHLLHRIFGLSRASSDHSLDPSICGWGNSTGKSPQGQDVLEETFSAVRPSTTAPPATRWTPFYQALNDFKASVRQALGELVKAAKDFIFAFLRWDLTIPFFNAGVGKYFIPVLGFKCQPVHACVSGFLDIPKALLNLMLEIGRGILNLFKALLKAASFREGPRDELDEDVPSDDSVQIPFDTNVTELSLGAVLYDTDRLLKDACLKNLRFKGSFSISWLTVGKLKLMFGTVPFPIEKWTSEIPTCIRKITRQFRNYLIPKNSKLTRLYFGPEQCNPHTVGLCMMLEKTRQCDYKLEDNASIVVAKNPKGTDRMLRFCKVFDGVTLSLTKSQDDQKVHCVEALREKYSEGGNTIWRLDPSKYSEFNMGEGCAIVAQRMQETRKCTPPEGVGEAFMQCRRLHGCAHQRPPEPMLLRWEDYASRVMDIMAENLQLKRNPQTSKRVAELVETVASKGREFQARVDDSVANSPERLQEAAEIDPGVLFTHSLWKDHCFGQLDGESTWTKTVEKHFAKTMHKAKLATAGHSRKHSFHQIRRGLFKAHAVRNQQEQSPHSFFHRLSQGLRVDTWMGVEDWCTPSNFGDALPASKIPARTYEYSMAQFMVKGDRHSFGLKLENNHQDLVLETPGWAAADDVARLRLRKEQNAWKLHSCVGRHCGDLKEGARLRSLRLTMSTDADATVQHVCWSASQLMSKIKPLAGLMEASTEASFQEEHRRFSEAAQILKANADLIRSNDKIVDEEHKFAQAIDWANLGSLMGQHHFELAVDASRTDDPFEQLSTAGKDEYFADRRGNGARNKLALFLRRRQWTIVQLEGGELELRLRGEMASARQIDELAGSLLQPRRGTVLGAGLALHDLAVDLLSGLRQEFFYSEETQLDGIAAKIGEKAAELQQLDEVSCRLALVNFEFSYPML